MLLKIILSALALFYLATNILTAKRMSARGMYNTFIDGQCLVGAICANIYYLPAWLLQALRRAVLAMIA